MCGPRGNDIYHRSVKSFSRCTIPFHLYYPLAAIFCGNSNIVYIMIKDPAQDLGIHRISSVGSQNLITLIFTKTIFCQCGNTKRMAHILSNSHSSRPIRTALKSINHASKYLIYERYHYFGSLFTMIRCFAMKKMLKMSQLGGLPRKYAQNDITQVNLSKMTMKSLLEVQNTNNSEFGYY